MKGIKITPIKLIILLGLVSLCADITYEGARSITGPYLSILGASAATVGLIGGIGELLGYSSRIVVGYMSDKSKRYWTLTITGYTLNFAVPLLALVNSWELAAILILVERLGKAIRTPARDTIIAKVSKDNKRGYYFGLHEALDKIGAIVGPVILAISIYTTGDYRYGFSILFIPVLISLIILFIASRYKVNDESITYNSKYKYPRTYWFYILFTTLTLTGFINFQLLSYHLKTYSIFNDIDIPLLYALAMGISSIVGFFGGRMFDKSGLNTLYIIPLLSVFITPLVLSLNYIAVIIGIVLWGCVFGIQNSVMRAAVASISSADKYGMSYGIFNGMYGIALFVGSSVMGILYELSNIYIVMFSITLEVVAIILLIFLKS